MLQKFVNLLDQWQHITSLVGPQARRDIWERHIYDCQSLIPFVDQALAEQGEGDDFTLVDIGSGAGFPGMILAIHYKERSQVKVHLVDKSFKKCTFLEMAAHTLGLSFLQVHHTRVEQLALRPHVLTARALAPMPRLWQLTQHLFGPYTLGLFMKGKQAGQELKDCPASVQRCARIYKGQCETAIVAIQQSTDFG